MTTPTVMGEAIPGLVSVIMPCFNAANFLAQAVASALEQTHGAMELILVDDGSTDGSPEIAASLKTHYGGRMRCLRTDRTGPYPARNFALRLRGASSSRSWTRMITGRKTPSHYSMRRQPSTTLTLRIAAGKTSARSREELRPTSRPITWPATPSTPSCRPAPGRSTRPS